MRRSTAMMCLLTGLSLLGGVSACSSNKESDEGWANTLLPPSPGDVARDAFNVYDPDKRRRSINQLSNAPWGGEAPYLRTYRLLVNDPDPTVRAASLRAIGNHGGTEDVPAITSYLTDKTSFVRWEAAMALQRIHHASAIDPLIKTLREDDDSDVRVAVANALAQYPDSRVFQALVGALNDDDFAVQQEAHKSLSLLTAQDFGIDGAAWLAWGNGAKDLFAQQQTYYYPQFDRPPTFLETMQFWKGRKQIIPTEPRTTEVALGPAADPSIPSEFTPTPKPAPAPAPAPTPAQTPVTPAPAPKPTVQPPVTPAPAPQPQPKPTVTPPPAPAPAQPAKPQPSTPAEPMKPQPTPTQPAAQPKPTPPAPAKPTEPKPGDTDQPPPAKPAKPTPAPGSAPKLPAHPLGATDGSEPPPLPPPGK
jgi:hypothetical protein